MFPEILIGLVIAIVICYWPFRVVLKNSDMIDFPLVLYCFSILMVIITFAVGYPLSGIM